MRKDFKLKLTKIATDYIHMKDIDSRIYQVLEDAIERQTKVNIQYGSYFRTISPFSWGTSKDGNITIKAYDEEGNVKSYTANKITKAVPKPNDSANKQKYNENITPTNEYDQMQNDIDKKYKGEDRMIAKLKSRIKTKLGQNEVLEEITFSIIEDIKDRLFEEYELEQVSMAEVRDILDELVSQKYEDILMEEGYDYLDISDVIDSRLSEVREEHNESIDEDLAPLDNTASKKQVMKRYTLASEEMELDDVTPLKPQDFEVTDIEIDTNTGKLTVMMKNLKPDDYDLLYSVGSGSEYDPNPSSPSSAIKALNSIIINQGYGKYLKQATEVMIWFE